MRVAGDGLEVMLDLARVFSNVILGKFGDRRVYERVVRPQAGLAGAHNSIAGIHTHEQAAIAKRDIASLSGVHLEQWIAVLPPLLVKRLGPGLHAFWQFGRDLQVQLVDWGKQEAQRAGNPEAAAA